jgi:hypothetical protein
VDFRTRMDFRNQWNYLVGLKAPTLAEIKSASSEWITLRPDIPEWKYVGNNQVVVGPRGETNLSGKVINLILAVDPQIFDNPAKSSEAAFQPLPEVSLFGISLRKSAADFAKVLKPSGRGKLDVATVSNMDETIERWEIYYGGSLLLAFKPHDPNDDNPARSELYKLMFSYQIPFTGKLPATLT